jgi:undecaprenyl-diphosphatase
MLETLMNLDRELMVALNLSGSHTTFMNGFFWMISQILIWLPAVLVLFYVLGKDKKKEAFLIVLSVALVFLLCDQISSGLMKPMLGRLRTGKDPLVMNLLEYVNNYRGGRFGFPSSHAANSFGFAMFTSLLFKHKPYTAAAFIWASLCAYSRIYLGVHYPGDIICGTLVGILCGLLVYRIYSFIRDKMRSGNRGWISDNYTKSGYSVSDIHFVLMVLYATFALIPAIAFITLHCKLI